MVEKKRLDGVVVVKREKRREEEIDKKDLSSLTRLDSRVHRPFDDGIRLLYVTKFYTATYY